MSDQIDRTLRAAMGTIVEVAPEAPEVPTVHSNAPAWRGAFSYVVAGFAITALFAVVGLMLFDRDGASPADTTPIDTPARPADLLLFPTDGATELSLSEVVEEVRAWDGVEFVSSWTGEQAFEEYLRQFPHEERESTVYREEFLGSIRVWRTEDLDEGALVTAAEGWGYEVSGSGPFIPLMADPPSFGPDSRVFLMALEVTVPPEAYNPPTVRIYGTDLASTPLRRLWIEETNYGGGIEGVIPDNPAAVEQWTDLEVPTGTAIIAQGAVGPMILWEPEPGGPVVRVSSLGVSADSLTDIALNLEPTPDGWIPTALPDGFDQLVVGSMWAVKGLNVNQTVWPTLPREQNQPLLLLQQLRGGTDAVEMSLYGLVGRSASPGPYVVDVIEVRGNPAFRVDYTEGSTPATFLTWAEGPDHLVTAFITGVPVDTVLDALYRLSVDQWEALRQRRPGSGEASPTTTMVPTTTVTSRAISLEVIYTPTGYPNIRSITIRSDNPSLDLSGWILASVGDPSLGFQFPAGTEIPPSGSLGVVQRNARPGDCPDATTSTVFVCYDQSNAPFPGRAIVLLDADGAEAARWDPPTGGDSDALP